MNYRTKVTVYLSAHSSDKEAMEYVKSNVFVKTMKDPTKEYTSTIQLSNGKLFTAYYIQGRFGSMLRA